LKKTSHHCPSQKAWNCSLVFSNSLQRALSEQDVTFKQLLLELRMEVAEHYLQSSALALSDLTEMLGYRNLSAFSRAFKHSHGESPEQWKKHWEHAGVGKGNR